MKKRSDDEVYRALAGQITGQMERDLAANNAADDTAFLQHLRRGPLERAIDAARGGDATALRKLYPHLAEFLQPLKPGRGQYKRPAPPDREQTALYIYRLVRAVAPQHRQRIHSAKVAARYCTEELGIKISADEITKLARRPKQRRSD